MSLFAPLGIFRWEPHTGDAHLPPAELQLGHGEPGQEKHVPSAEAQALEDVYGECVL